MLKPKEKPSKFKSAKIRTGAKIRNGAKIRTAKISTGA